MEMEVMDDKSRIKGASNGRGVDQEDVDEDDDENGDAWRQGTYMWTLGRYM